MIFKLRSASAVASLLRHPQAAFSSSADSQPSDDVSKGKEHRDFGYAVPGRKSDDVVCTPNDERP